MEGRGQLAAIADPFSKQTNNPKIPDGEQNTSLGVRKTLVNELFAKDGQTDITLYLFPGLYSHLAAVDVEGEFDHYDFDSEKIDPSTTVLRSFAYDLHPAHTESWRYVSGAMRVALTTSMEHNDGWWEACRVDMKMDNDNFVWEPTTGQPIMKPQPDNSNMPDQPSYVSGKLRDIHKYQFNLIHNDTDVPFISHNYNETYTLAELNNTTGSLVEGGIQKNIQAIKLVLHGVAWSPTATSTLRSKFLVQTVANYELKIRVDSNLKVFTTSCHNLNSSWEKLVRSQNRLASAAWFRPTQTKSLPKYTKKTYKKSKGKYKKPYKKSYK